MPSAYTTDVYGGLELLDPPSDLRVIARWQGVGPGTGVAHFHIPSDAEDASQPYPVRFQTKDVIVFAMNIPEAMPTVNTMFDDTYRATWLDFGATEAGNGLPIKFDADEGVTVGAPEGFAATIRQGFRLAWIEKTDDDAWLCGGPDLVPAA